MRRLLLTLVLLALAAPALAQTSAALTRANYARDNDTQMRVEFLTVKVALSVFAENPDTCCGATTDVSQAQHDKRMKVAAIALRDPTSLRFRITLAVLTNTSITLTSTDADVEAVIRDQWDDYAEAMVR